MLAAVTFASAQGRRNAGPREETWSQLSHVAHDRDYAVLLRDGSCRVAQLDSVRDEELVEKDDVRLIQYLRLKLLKRTKAYFDRCDIVAIRCLLP